MQRRLGEGGGGQRSCTRKTLPAECQMAKMEAEEMSGEVCLTFCEVVLFDVFLLVIVD